MKILSVLTSTVSSSSRTQGLINNYFCMNAHTHFIKLESFYVKYFHNAILNHVLFIDISLLFQVAIETYHRIIPLHGMFVNVDSHYC